MFEKEVLFLKKKDPILAQIINESGELNFHLTENPFEALVESILYQQLATKVAHSIVKKFKSLYKNFFPTPEELFNTPEEKLKSAGVSPQKIKYLKDLSSKFIDGTLNPSEFSHKTDEEIIAEVTKVKGIGKWSAEMFLIFSLGRKDVFPFDDLGIQKAIKKWYGINDVKIMIEFSQRWKPYRSIAILYLWKSLRNEPFDI